MDFDSCKNCKFWLGNNECRRYPPIPQSYSKAYWPKTQEYYWCGEYKIKSSDDPKRKVKLK